PVAAKSKKNEFTQPPDQKGERVGEDSKTAEKSEAKPLKGDDSKFTSEDILQVMRRGGKDDVMVDEKATRPSPQKKEDPAVAPKAAVENSESLPPLKREQVDGLKGILAELSAVSGIIRCFLIGNDGITVVSISETSNNA